ncbi:MAG: peptidoglycan DD-metalloendopeptidase family protein [Sphingobacteriia bacterium]|nr:peptidoglycan DD-metalloendopeptidase family protein [Sphingobacteriia bacterium]
MLNKRIFHKFFINFIIVIFLGSVLSACGTKQVVSPKLKARQEFEQKFAARFGKESANLIVKYDLFGLSNKKCIISDFYADAYNGKVSIDKYRNNLHKAYEKFMYLTENELEYNVYEKLVILSKRYNQFAGKVNLSPKNYVPKKRTLIQMLKSTVKFNKKFRSIPTIHPVKKFQVTSHFGMRIHPIKRKKKFHSGIDLVSHAGHIPIYASSDGKVVFAGKAGTFGNLIKINHGNNIHTYYAHLDKIYIKKGAVINAGQVIGEMGTTGRSNGLHLHYEIRIGDKAIDPFTFVKINNCGA